MANTTKQPFMDPAVNPLAGTKAMDGKNVRAVLVVNPDGDPVSFGAAGIGSTSVVSSVASSMAVQTLAASNTARIAAKIFNASTADLYVKEGSGATLSDYSYKLLPGDLLIVKDYNGILTGLWSAVNGAAKVTITTA
jgi:hypothetical protein